MPTDSKHDAARQGLALIDVLLVVSLVLALFAWFFDPYKAAIGPVHLSLAWGLKTQLFPVLLLGLRVWLARRAGEDGGVPAKPGLVPRLALALAVTLIFLVGLDASLGLVGIKPAPGMLALRQADGTTINTGGAMVYDSTLLWRFQPGAIFNGRRVNALGFLDREVTAHKSPGTHRIICMGDSCTAQGQPTYAGRLNERLQVAQPAPGNWEAFNTGVHGYSVLQGLALFNQRVRDFEPDVVTIYFGWNDHWLDFARDSERMAAASASWRGSLYRALSRKRLHGLLRGAAPSAATRQLRVPPEEYERGLHALIRSIRDAGAEPVVLTAPRAESLTGHLVRSHTTSSLPEAIRLHDQYVDITRRVAGEERARLIDLALEFAGPANAPLFSDDGIHFTNAGRDCIAERILKELELPQAGEKVAAVPAQ